MGGVSRAAVGGAFGQCGLQMGRLVQLRCDSCRGLMQACVSDEAVREAGRRMVGGARGHGH